jgi:[ribosomal protein S18]-alanine N-acetyltransferase
MPLRTAVAADVAQLVAIERSSFLDPWSARSFERLLEASHATVTVLELSGGAVAGFTVLLHAVDEAELANIAVGTAYRGRGFGGTLLAHAIERARQLAVTTIFLEVRPSNQAALALYARSGFAEIGRRRRYYTAPIEDALVLSRAV